MAEDLMREIHTQLNLITNDLAALPREDRIAWFRRTTLRPARCIFSKRSTVQPMQ